jgi:hypothetical protein
MNTEAVDEMMTRFMRLAQGDSLLVEEAIRQAILEAGYDAETIDVDEVENNIITKLMAERARKNAAWVHWGVTE